MTSNQSGAGNTNREQPRRRMGRLSGAIMAAFFGSISFFSVASSSSFDTIRTLDVIRLMTAGAGFGVAFVLLAWFLKSQGTASRS